MISSSLVLASAQRLLRRLCEKCKKPSEVLPPEDYLRKNGFLEDEIRDMVLFEPVGCQACLGGYKGRFAILEAMVVNAKIRQMIVGGESSIKIKKYAISKGMTTLRRCAILNAIRGRTSLQEVMNMTMGDES